MNAPLPESVRKAIESASLDDKYSLSSGRAFMSGVQALVRLPMLQRQRDAAAGLNTGGFISGYRGSPLGAYDQALWAAKKHLAANAIVFPIHDLPKRALHFPGWNPRRIGGGRARRKNRGTTTAKWLERKGRCRS